MASIKAIDAASVHQITSGQVIVDLQTAVKELVENSLDAGATNIDIKFKNYGSQSFEVIDNGSGVQPKDYAHIALKGYTSKLENYDGLTSVTSFGFRGEALSSLCQLADVVITTATENEAPIGTVLTFDKRGQLLASSSKAARSRGTTVNVANLFSGMPVRKKEFDKNNKKHFGAAQTLLQAYGLISVGKRITLSNQQEGKPVQTLFKTDGKSLRDNYATLFGFKSAAPLLDLDLELEVEAAKRVLKMAGVDELRTKVCVRGLISPPNANAGRTSGDRQFLFVNGRPFEAKAITKAFNEVFKSYAPQHFPSIVADFELATDSYDVNVSPDKRSIFLHSEQNLIEALKTALDAFYSPSRATFSMDATNMTRVGRLSANVTPTMAAVSRPPTSRSVETLSTSTSRGLNSEVETDSPDGKASRKKRSPLSAEEEEDLETPSKDVAIDPAQGDVRPPPLFRAESGSQSSEVLEDEADIADARPERLPSVQAKLAMNGTSWKLSSSSAIEPASKRARKEKQATVEQQATLDRMNVLLSRASNKSRPGSSRVDSATSISSSSDDVHSEDIDLEDDKPDNDDTDADLEESQGSIAPTDAEHGMEDHGATPGDEDEVMLLDGPGVIETDTKQARYDQHASELAFDLDSVRERLKASRQKRKPVGKAASLPRDQDELAEAGIKTQDEDARKALSRLVSKEDFAKMQIVGQFNLAFIIVRRREAIVQGGADDTEPGPYHDDLMIIDQHASDEKYNFERLQQVTKIDSQRLIKPRMIELPASDELLAIEHENVLRFNGFEIEVDEDAPVGQRIKLVSMPISKSTKKTEFTIEDFEELLFLLRERTGVGMIRPTKTRRLFAMLACRSSVMVGKVLNASQMSTIVKHMGTLDQPWNCPHGRNTMRWLTNLEVSRENERMSSFATKLKSFAANL
ncbi:DNA mismatch repair protein MutL [Cystobasidium minutum MCA 4210]|uniref:DNA mismatch repair protein MutL n=1 Tax=Cystobasidium minutum MCA 4210 TaxID=1397322 RepID=UPI0034CF924F|eukprot:jgi/Rhomi1/93571/CE93570_709